MVGGDAPVERLSQWHSLSGAINTSSMPMESNLYTLVPRNSMLHGLFYDVEYF